MAVPKGTYVKVILGFYLLKIGEQQKNLLNNKEKNQKLINPRGEVSKYAS